MKLLTQDAVLVCQHLGVVKNTTSQALVTIGHRLLLIEPDPAGRPIDHCPMSGANIKKCSNTQGVEQGYSTLLRTGGRRVCLDTVTGNTDGTAPGHVYTVRDAGQTLVTEAA